MRLAGAVMGKNDKAVKREAKQLEPYQFKKGHSGNPKGRPKGSRNALGEAFISAMHSDFQEHGDDVIEKVRKEKPDQYLKVIASILPKELNVNTNPLEDMSDDELVTLLDAVRSLLAASPVDGTTDGDAEATRH